MRETGETETATITPRHIAFILAAGAMVFPVLSLFGWLSGARILASFGTKYIPMAPSTTSCFLLLSTALIILLRRASDEPRIIGAAIVGGFVSLYGALTFLGSQTGLPISPDYLIFPDMGTLGGSPIGRMASSTGLFFLLTGASLLSAGRGMFQGKQCERWRFWTGLLSGIVVLGAGVFILGYVFSSPFHYGGSTIPMAMTTALSFLLLGGSLLMTASLQSELFDKGVTKLRDLKIGTQLRIGLGTILAFVLFLGAGFWFKEDSMWKSARDIYEHPLTVRGAISALTTDIMRIHMDMENLPQPPTEPEILTILQSIALYDADVKRQIETIRKAFLGDLKEVDDIDNAAVQYKTARDETIRLLHAGNSVEVMNRLRSGGTVSVYLNKLIAEIRDVSEFAQKKGEQIHANAQSEREAMTMSLAILLGTISLLTFGIIYILSKRINEPLQELISAAEQYRKGNLDARSRYISANEFGGFSDAFNSLAETIQGELKSRENVARIADAMVGNEKLSTFCEALLPELITGTNSNIGAVYFLREEKDLFEPYFSVGMTQDKMRSFSAGAHEGEFGAVLIQKKIIRISDIPEDTIFEHATFAGNIKPKEIITIPIMQIDNVIAVICLASLNAYSEAALALVTNSWKGLNIGFIGMLAFEKIRDYSRKLDQQNTLLEQQAGELKVQADEMRARNERIQAQSEELQAQSMGLRQQAEELREQNLELEQQRLALEEASRLKSQFLSNMSHELRTPLNSVMALSRVLMMQASQKLSDEEVGYLEIIGRNGKNLLTLINDILDLAKIEAGRMDVNSKPFSISQTIDNIVESITPLAEEK
ncbi:MAG: MCP four helix bundle domain-containing protein, partial [Candidatus Riflebacteria bacterium]|nr:MCP four helix bundle domain-containing protein [Candidatus Riflebacteria bacterium]